MNVNSRSEAVWEVLHHAEDLLRHGGFTEPVPSLPRPQGSRPEAQTAPGEAYADLALRYRQHLAFGTGWPQGVGPVAPLAVVLTEAALTEEALGFVRSWFENPRVKLVLAEQFFLQPLPTLAGDRPPYQAWAKELCQLLQPKAVLSLGAIPAQRLLGAPLSLDTLRSSDYRFDRWSIVTTFDPELFVSLPDDEKGKFKAQVWKDLQRLLGKLRYG